MKFRLLLLAVLLIVGTALSAQKLHNLREIMDIMTASDVTYSIATVDFSDSVYDYTKNLLGNNVYRTKGSNGMEIKEYELEGQAAELFDEAENFFQKQNYSSARSRYQKVLELNPTCYKVISYIGDTYFHEGDLQKAREWYKKAIDKNYIDYLAHWFYADACLGLGDKQTALREITIAKVLNRNNPRLTKKLQQIYKLNKLDYKDWYFTPKYALEKSYDAKRDTDVVKVSYGDFWLGYALVQAVWHYEPGYAESMDNSFLLQSKEAVAAVALSTDKKAQKKDIALRALDKALSEGSFEAYVLYEDILPQNPRVCWYLDEEAVEKLADYVLKVRCKIK